MRWRYGPSVTRDFGAAAVASKRRRGVSARPEKSGLSAATHIPPVLTCTHSWQNTMYGLLPSMKSVPSSAIMSSGVAGLPVTGRNGPVGAADS